MGADIAAEAPSWGPWDGILAALFVLVLTGLLFARPRPERGRYTPRLHAHFDVYTYRVWDQRECRWLVDEAGRAVEFASYDDARLHARVLNDGAVRV